MVEGRPKQSFTEIAEAHHPPLFHPQYVDGAKQLTQHNDPTGYVDAIAKIARWYAQFDDSELARLIDDLRRTNAFEEHSVRDTLLNLNNDDAFAQRPA